MAKRKKNAEKYYRVGNKLRVHGYNDAGRYVILRYDDIEDLKGYNVPAKGGKHKMVEYIFHYQTTNSQKIPSGMRNWEVRIQLPEGREEFEVREIANEVLGELTNEDMVDTSQVSKLGKDTVRYTVDDSVQWMVIDTTRPQYKYPSKKGWGRYTDV